MKIARKGNGSFICLAPTGEMPPVLAGGEVGQVPVLRGRPDGRVQHAPVHPEGVQSDRRQGKQRLPGDPVKFPWS